MDDHIQVSFAAPAVVLDFLSFIYRLSFIDEWKTATNTMDGFYRTGMFTVAAPVGSWVRLFKAMKTLDSSYFSNRVGLLAFAVFVQFRPFAPEFEQFSDMPDFASMDDPVLIKKGLFAYEMDKITFIEKSHTSFAIEK